MQLFLYLQYAHDDAKVIDNDCFNPQLKHLVSKEYIIKVLLLNIFLLNDIYAYYTCNLRI